MQTHQECRRHCNHEGTCGGTHPLRFDMQLVTFSSFIRSNNNNPPRPMQKLHCSGHSCMRGCYARPRELHTMRPCVLGAPPFSLLLLSICHFTIHDRHMTIHVDMCSHLAEAHSLLPSLPCPSPLLPRCVSLPVLCGAITAHTWLSPYSLFCSTTD